jgi:hypothetical protein
MWHIALVTSLILFCLSTLFLIYELTCYRPFTNRDIKDIFKSKFNYIMCMIAAFTSAASSITCIIMIWIKDIT